MKVKHFDKKHKPYADIILMLIRRLFTGFILAILLLFSLINFYSFSLIGIKETDAMLQEISSEINFWMSDIEGNVDALAHAIGVNPYLSEETYFRMFQEVYRELESQGVTEVYIGFTETKITIKGSGASVAPDYDPTSRPWYQLADQNAGTQVTEAYYDAFADGLCVTVCRKVPKVGVIAVDIKMDRLAQIKEQVLSNSNFDFGVVILSQNSNSIIYHKDGYEIDKSRVEDALQNAHQGDDVRKEYFKDEGKLQLSRLVTMDTLHWNLIGVVPMEELSRTPFFLAAVMLAVGLLGYTIFILFFRRVAKRGFQPLTLLAERVQYVARGNYNEQFDIPLVSQELESLRDSLLALMHTISNNAEVVKRVADGDMTVFVNVNSENDELGKSLYRLVQSNDKMYAEMLGIAEAVSDGAMQINAANHSMAEGSKTQMESLKTLLESMHGVQDISSQNQETAVYADAFSKTVSQTVDNGLSNMKNLQAQIKDLVRSSNEISKITKEIEDIAFQTNILALNASVESARAGVAGKGFAVVADEVRNLAAKSAEAASNTRKLLEESASLIATSDTAAVHSLDLLQQMVREVDDFVSVIGNIHNLSAEQFEAIVGVRNHAESVMGIAQENVKTCEESLQTSHKMNEGSEILHEAMRQFRLRQRKEDQPYIPKEKQDDPHFIQFAKNRYQQHQHDGQYQEYLRPEEEM